ncbi:MAG: response regulator [Steroidobacteraceae bacterium]|nr:response regulator [Steroidobacteraceae bacterium]
MDEADARESNSNSCAAGCRTFSTLTHALRLSRVIAWDYAPQTGLLTHHTPAEVYGPIPSPLPLKRALRLVHPEDRRTLLSRVRAATRRGEPFIQHFRAVCSTAQQPLWVELHGTVVRDDVGVPVRVSGAVVDITAHKQAVDALAAADRRKDDFLATLAHELRNPLTAIGTAAHLLRNAHLESNQMSACVDMIRRQASHLARLVDDLLDVSRIIRDRLELQRERLDVCACLMGALDAVRASFTSKHHDLHIHLPHERLEVEGDKVRLAQVFANILTNAAKYTPERGSIAIAVERSSQWAVIRVRDSGIGITAADLPHVFDAFYQVDASLAHARGGLGIGLALVRRIAELHGGSAEAYSEGLGHGSEFVVRLPLAEQPSSAAEPPARADVTLSTDRPLRILVADDNADVAEAIALTLRMYGHEVAVALDGEEALRVADRLHPQVALLDVGMPGREGHEVAREIRRRAWALRDGVLVIALTGWNPAELRGRLDMSAFDEQIVKPTDMEVVNRLIASVFGRRRNGFTQ